MANKKPKRGGLNEKQRRFVAEYLIDLNATQAAIRAGYSRHTAKSQGQRLLTNVAIAAAVGTKTQKQIEKLDISADYVLRGLKEVGERCMTRVPVMVRDGRHLVQKTDENGEGVWEFDSAGANRALELLGKHLALFTDKLALTAKVSLSELIEQSEQLDQPKSMPAQTVAPVTGEEISGEPVQDGGSSEIVDPESTLEAVATADVALPTAVPVVVARPPIIRRAAKEPTE